MSVGLWVVQQDVRDFANFTGTDGRYSDAQIGSNIRAAERYLQKTTGRQWEAETATKTFSTSGQPSVAIPDLRSVSAITLNTASLTVNETYWLVPSSQESSIYVGLQVRPYNRSGSRWYLGIPDWWDRGLDLPEGNWYSRGIPNDLSITGDWGWSPIPEDVQHAVKVLAAFYTLRADAVLAGARTSTDGTVYDLSNLPLEVQDFIQEWKGGQQAVAI